MRLRIKLSRGRPAVSVEVGDTDTVAMVKRAVVEGWGIRGQFELSLNRKETLNEDQTLCDLGIVNGDLLFILRDEPTELSSDSESQNLCKKAAENMTTIHSVCTGQASKDLAVLQTKPEESVQQAAGASGVVSMDTEAVDAKAASLCAGRAFVSGGQYDEFIEGRMEIHPDATPFDILCVALHSLMLDYGFPSDETEATAAPTLAGAGVCKRRYSTAVSEVVRVDMVCVKMGPMLTVNATASSTLPELPSPVSRTIHLIMNTYVHNSVSSKPHQKLKNPKQLSRVFRDTLAHKLLMDIRKGLGLPEVGTLMSLFPEMKLQVLKYLDVRTLLAVSAVCKELYFLCQDKFIWRDLVLRDFRKAAVNYDRSLMTSKEVYIELYKVKQQQRRMFALAHDVNMVPPLYPRGIYPPELGPPLVPGILGGDYDRFPRPPLPRTQADVLRRLQGPRFSPYSPAHDIPRHPEADLLHGPPIQPLPSHPWDPYSVAGPASNRRARGGLQGLSRLGGRRQQFGGLRL